MKVYFANNQYLSVTNATEDYQRGNYYCTLMLTNPNLTVETLMNFFSQPDVLSKVIIVSDDNHVLATMNDRYHSVYDIHRTIGDISAGGLQVRLSSSADGLESMI